MNPKTTWKGIALVMTAAFVVLALPGGATTSSPAPADKVSVAGSSIEILSAPLKEGSSSETVTLLSTDLKTSSPTDLLLYLTLECSLWTQVTTVGNDESESVATVSAWIELDGTPISVSSGDAENGKVVFCDRAHKQATSGFENENATIEQHLRTKSANGFNWAVLDVGSGTHTLTVMAQLEAHVTNLGMAKSGIGHRTLIVEPVKLATGATL